MAAVDVCAAALTLALVILTTTVTSGQADSTNCSVDDEANKINTIIDKETRASPKALSLARSIIDTVTRILSFGNNVNVAAPRAKNEMIGIMMNPYFLIPQLIMLGFAPVVLANLKMLVMKALMMNNMALSTALFMTIRSLVFGPSLGPQIKYVNYGYGETQPHLSSSYPPRDRRSVSR